MRLSDKVRSTYRKFDQLGIWKVDLKIRLSRYLLGLKVKFSIHTWSEIGPSTGLLNINTTLLKIIVQLLQESTKNVKNITHTSKFSEKNYLFYKNFEILAVKGPKLSIFEQGLHEKNGIFGGFHKN